MTQSTDPRSQKWEPAFWPSSELHTICHLDLYLDPPTELLPLTPALLDRERTDTS